MTTLQATLIGGSPTDQQYVGTAFTEAAKWIAPLLAGSATINYQITIHPGIVNNSPFVVAYTAVSAQVQPDVIYEPDAAIKMRTGIDPDPGPEAFIDINLPLLVQQPNAIITMMHEELTAFAFNGGGPASDQRTPFNTHEQMTPQGWAFVGSFAEQVTGGPVLMSPYSDNRYAQPGLMDPFAGNGLYGISALDVAMLADSGVPIVAAYLPHGGVA